MTVSNYEIVAKMGTETRTYNWKTTKNINSKRHFYFLYSLCCIHCTELELMSGIATLMRWLVNNHHMMIIMMMFADIVTVGLW